MPRAPSTASPVSDPLGQPGHPILALVADCGADPAAQLEKIRAALAGGVNWVQIRDRGAEPADLLHFADAVREAGAPRLLINRRLDVALASGADGAHLGFDALSLADARACWRAATGNSGPAHASAPLFGVSTHSVEEAHQAWKAGADYVHLAAIYPPISKRGGAPAIGPAPLRELGRLGIPVLAQGGIEVKRVESVIEAGARGVAVTGAILGADDCEHAARALRDALDRCESHA